MARVTFHRAPAWTGALLIGYFTLLWPSATFSQTTSAPPPTPTVAPPPAALSPQPTVTTPTPAPTWLSPSTPMMQVGPDGAVQLDQPMIMSGAPAGGQYYYPGQPMMVGPQPQMAPYVGAPMAAPYSPWGAPVMQPQAGFAGLFGPPQPVAAGPLLPFYLHRASVYGEFLYMRPRDAEVAYALPIDGPVAPVLGNEVPVGPTAVVDPDYDISFRAGFGLPLDQGSSMTAQYTRLRSDSTDAVTVVAPTVLRSLVSHPLGANAATDTLDATASLDINLDAIDLDFRSLWYGCECNYGYAINYLAGAQYAMLDQEFGATYETIGTTAVGSSVDFTGIGLRFGLEGERIWPKVNIFVYGTSVVNFLFGEFDATYAQSNSFNGIEAATSWSAGRIVPVVDFEFGAGWLGINRHLRLSAGYRVSTWFNVVKTEDWIWAAQNHDFRNLDGTLTFDGLVGRAEWLF